MSINYFSNAQQIELIFSHKYHAEEVGAACTDCHAVAESSSSADNLLPNMESCYNCHDSEQECTVCHKDPDNAVVYPRITDYIAKFSHQKHMSDEQTCNQCHNNVAMSENILDKHLPKMNSCVTCHTNETKDDYCLICHEKGENLIPADHNVMWDSEHGIAANNDENTCSSCHLENSCTECHEGDNLDHKVHSLNYVNNHGIYARGNKDNCLTCHEEFIFCNECHIQRMVLPRTHSRANWTNKTTGGVHARAAKMDMDLCVSCHSDVIADPVCVLCHQ